MTRPSDAALVLLELALGNKRGVGWAAAQEALGLSTGELKEVVRELTERGLLKSADPLTMRPPLLMTDQGRELLGRIRGGTPVRTLTLFLTSADDEEVESIQVVLEAEGNRLAEDVAVVSSYLLSAIRYLLVLAPGALSADMTTAAARHIGEALLPCRQKCRNGEVHRRADCVRGVFEDVLGEASASEGWIRLELRVEPPWTYVPWEMAALDQSTRLVLDRRVSVSRRVSDGLVQDVLEGQIDVLLMTPAADSVHQRDELIREAGTIAAAIGRVASGQRNLSVDIATDFTDGADMASRIAQATPTMVHVLGHGSEAGLATSVGTISHSEAAGALAQPSVSSVILSSCFGATSFGTNRAGSSLAWSVADRGVPSVIAFEGSAEATHSVNFAIAFYPALALSGSVERAVQAGRESMGKGSAYEQFGQVVLFRG